MSKAAVPDRCQRTPTIGDRPTRDPPAAPPGPHSGPAPSTQPRRVDGKTGEPAFSGTARHKDALVWHRCTVSSSAMLLRAQDLDVRYAASRALFNVSIDIPKGTVVAVLGPNGAG